jgi:serine/threonine protein kinase/tetratricopeptide (TPR) repeat protein
VNESRIFTNALKLGTAAERAAFLDRACAGDPGLRVAVEELLRARDSDPDFLEPGQSSTGTPTVAPPSTERPGVVLAGRYKLVEEIGEGGMGTVWLAQQTEPVRRTVAVKLVKPGMDSKTVLARFEAERQALALMDHPNIARVYDAGIAPDGRPFFVMELVKGVPVTQFCDDRKLTPRQRLELFVPVCQAVQHAHQKGIIHRDLKPSNILVALFDERPVPKVIDFGVAKATGLQLIDATLHTSFGAVVGTVEYMSPEQATFNQLDIDTRSDVYSLGVLLYELLTGTTPLDRKHHRDTPLLELLRIVREDDTVRPSARLSTVAELPTVAARRGLEPKKLSGLVRGELDWIVMRALDKDRNRRYETASALATDVVRYLADEPVLACPPSAGYRVRKFIRRNKGPVLAASVVFFTLFGGVVGTTLGMVRAEDAREGAENHRQAAEKNAERAVAAQELAEAGFTKADEAVEHYLQAVTNDPDLKHKHDLLALRKKLLQGAVPFFQWFIEQKPGDAAFERKRARAYWRLAFVRNEAGEKEAALKDYEHMQAALSRLEAEYPDVPAYREDLATCLNNRGNLLAEFGKRQEAEQAYRRALELQTSLAETFPGTPSYRHDLARSHYNLARLLAILGRRDAAEEQFRRAVDLREALVAASPRVATYRDELAASYDALGMLLKGHGNLPKAEQALRRALELRAKLATDSPDNPEARLDLAKSHLNVGNLLAEIGQRPAAERSYRQALEIQDKLVAKFPSMPTYRGDQATTHINLANLLARYGETGPAERSYQQAVNAFEKLATDCPTVSAYQQQLATSVHNLGNLMRDLQQWPRAEQFYRRSLEIREKLAAGHPTVPDYRDDLADSHNAMGLVFEKRAQPEAAERAYRQALEHYEALVSNFPELASSRRGLAGSSVNFGHFLRDQGKGDASLVWYSKAIALLEPVVSQDSRRASERRYLRNAHWGRALALDEQGRHTDAMKDWDRALALNQVPVAEPMIRGDRALCLAHTGDHQTAFAEANAVATLKRVTAETLFDVARACAVAATQARPDAKLQHEYAARAVELLRQAVATGFKDAARLKTDRDLKDLRDRPDFNILVAELEGKKK